MANESFPRKYWWVVLVALPVGLALIQYQPWTRIGAGPGGSPSVSGVSGNQFLGPAIVGNVSVVVNEAAKAGVALDPALIEQLKRAAGQSKDGDHDAAVAQIEQVRASSGTLARLPSLSNNLGLEYLLAGKPVQARQAFERAIKEEPDNKAAWAGLAQLEPAALRPVTVVNFTGANTWGEPASIVDDDPNSTWLSADGSFPQSFIMQLPVEASVFELTFNTSNQNTAPRHLDIAFSSQSATSGFGATTPITLTKGDIGQSVALNPPRVGRWVKLRILSNYGEETRTSLAHLVFVGRPRLR